MQIPCIQDKSLRMTSSQNPRIDLNPGKTQRLDFDRLVMMNLPGKRAGQLRLVFKLIWLAHQISDAMYNKKGLRIASYWHIKEDIEERLSKERKEEVKLDITKHTIQKTLRYMRKAGYLRYVPLEDLWYFSGKASSALHKLADNIDNYQTSPNSQHECEKLIHDFTFGL